MAVIGPLTVHPSAEGGVGRMLMDAALTQARKQNHDQIRLVQSPSHIRSFVLYTKSGFTLREPLFLMQGQPLKGGGNTSSANVRLVRDENDISVCNELLQVSLRIFKGNGIASGERPRRRHYDRTRGCHYWLREQV